MKPEPNLLPQPPLGAGFPSQQINGSLEAFSAFGVSGWAVPKNPAAGPLAIHIVTARSYDIVPVNLPRPDVVMHGYNSLHSGFSAPLANWLSLGVSPADGPQTVTLIVMQGDVPCYRVNFLAAPADLLVPAFQFNVESAARTHISGWLASADTLAPLSLWAVNEKGEDLAIAATLDREDLLSVGPNARAFWQELPLRFTLRQGGLQLLVEQRGRRFPVQTLTLPDIVAFVEQHIEAQLAAGERPDEIVGWAVNVRTPGLRPRLRLESGGTTLWSGRATHYRPDIAAQTGTDGFAGFLAPLAMVPPGAPWSLWIGEGNDTRRLAGSGEA